VIFTDKITSSLVNGFTVIFTDKMTSLPVTGFTGICTDKMTSLPVTGFTVIFTDKLTPSLPWMDTKTCNRLELLVHLSVSYK
jgi:hypothetical protein